MTNGGESRGKDHLTFCDDSHALKAAMAAMENAEMRLKLVAFCVVLVHLFPDSQFTPTAAAQVLDPASQFQRQTFWVNKDRDWYSNNIPLFECPDEDITTTWYYRWELMTRHLT